MKRAYTLVEVTVALLVMSVVLAPALLLLSSGSRDSLQGLVQADTTLEARRIIRQVHQDLKLAAIETGPDSQESLSLERICKNEAALPLADYTFLRFPGQGAVAAVAPKLERRRLSRVRYRLEPKTAGNIPVMRLIRTETFHAGSGNQTAEHVLSERVNFFEIRPCALPSVRPESMVFQVTLKLVDSPRGPLPETLPSGALLSNHAQGVITAEYSDVVFPMFFAAYMNQPYIVRNYYSGGTAP